MFPRFSKIMASVSAVIVLTMLVSCASILGVNPKTFDERLAAGYVSVTTIRKTGAILVTAKAITANDGQNIQDSANNVRSGLDIARQLHDVLPQAGEDKLTSTLVILNGLQQYLDQKQKGVK